MFRRPPARARLVALARLSPGFTVYFQEIKNHAASERIGFRQAHHYALANGEMGGADGKRMTPWVKARARGA